MNKRRRVTKWKDYEAFEEINEQANLDVLSSRWVITQRGDKIKARLVVRGFQENEKPQADAPTASRESLRIFLSITANEKFDLKTIDVRSAFLQSNPIDRTILIKPPKDVKKEGKVWRLKKACYGLVDASRQFYMSVKDELNKFGMQMADNDEALFYHHDKNGNLDGLLILHVDDFLVAGSESFLTNLPNHLMKRFDFSKMERTVFQYTGVNIEQKKDKSILIDQITYIRRIKPLEFGKNKVGFLNEEEQNQYRSLTGQLLWVSEVTRLDVAYDVRELCIKNQKASYQDIRYANKVIEKIQKKDIRILFEPLGSYKDLKISLFTDAAFRNSEDKIKSVEGRVIILENPEGKRHVISAKSCTISKVCKSVKTAETRALENGMEKAIGIARMIQEIMTGRKFRKEEEYLSLPIKCVIDSKTLYESIHSTKQVQEVSIRILVAWIKEQINKGIAEDVMWTDTKKMIAVILTKRNVNPENFQKNH